MKITDKIDNVTNISKEYLSESPPVPISVKIELTGFCNFNCEFCAKARRLRQLGEMDKGFYESIVDNLAEIGVKELGLFYLGESFLCKWLPEAILYAKEAGIGYTFLTTNGAAANYDSIEKCMKAGLDSLKFSYNYHDGEQLKLLTGAPAETFEKIKNNIKAASEIREKNNLKCGLYASYIEYDGEQSSKMDNAIKQIEKHVDEIYALPLYNQAALVETKQKWNFTSGNQGRVGNLRSPLPCWALFTEGHISWDGHLSACCFDHDRRFHMGNLNEMTFMEAWHSEKFKELRRSHMMKSVEGTVCEQCTVW